jgi:hypothetical protein
LNKLLFHHIIPEKATFIIGDIYRWKHLVTPAEQIEELKNCALLCVPCHTSIHMDLDIKFPEYPDKNWEILEDYLIMIGSPYKLTPFESGLLECSEEQLRYVRGDSYYCKTKAVQQACL